MIPKSVAYTFIVLALLVAVGLGTATKPSQTGMPSHTAVLAAS